MFNKKKCKTIDLVDFSIQNISTGKIGSYIINFLYKEKGFTHIGYSVKNSDGDLRCTLYTLAEHKGPIRYFKDRCSGMIEERVQAIPEGIPHKFNKWDNGFEEVCE